MYAGRVMLQFCIPKLFDKSFLSVSLFAIKFIEIIAEISLENITLTIKGDNFRQIRL